MDKQKITTQSKTPFPLVDAILLTPDEGKQGFIGVCANTSASGQVYNEIEKKNRSYVSVLGSLIVNRDGAERMILNSLVHPTLKYLILFSEESLTFSPSTNLLQVLMNGFDESKTGNYIKEGKAAAANYPNLSKNIIDVFRNEIIVIPLFMYNNRYSKKVVQEYIDWLSPKIDKNIYETLKDINQKDKIYYDSLNKVIDLIKNLSTKPKEAMDLDPKEFSHLQPPRINLDDKELIPYCPFRVEKSGSRIRLDIKIGGQTYFIQGEDDFLISYSLMKFLGEKKKELNPLEQLFLGAELNRIRTEIVNNVSIEPFIKSDLIKGEEEILQEPNVQLAVDKKYYYKISAKDGFIFVACLAYDICEEVFELRSKTIGALLEKIAELNRFENYEMDILHRMDIGAQIGRAVIATKLGYTFIQDFNSIFKVNTEELPLTIVAGDNFLDIHKNILRNIYTLGITEEHGDSNKGLARTAAVLAVYRNTKKTLGTLSAFYQQGEQSTLKMREAYREQMLRFDHDGSYSYGQRTRSYFGFDQLENTIKVLKKNPKKAAVIQRFDITKDASFREENGELKFTHDPCLTHDVFLTMDNKLISFHIARAHNMVNAYPENIFGLYDAYVCSVGNSLGIDKVDMFMLSNRGNILLLTEEQRTKKILAEPSKPADEMDTSTGPFKIEENIKKPRKESGVFYIYQPLQEILEKPDSEILYNLENYQGINIIDKAINYLKTRGAVHNNPIVGEYQPGISDPRGDYLLFFQANVFGKKVHATAVFVNHALENKEKDIELCDYLATRYGKELGYSLGDLTMFYII